jgi:hypothetical protein
MPLSDTGSALFAGSAREFARMAPASSLTAHLVAAFQRRWGAVSDSEVRAWRNSLTAMAAVVEESGLAEAGTGVEFKLPNTDRRVDVFFVGRSHANEPGVTLVELKQWESAAPSMNPDNVVVGGREMLHPSVQAAGYAEYLRAAHSAFTEENLGLAACAYLHNMPVEGGASLRGLAYEGAVREAPFYVGGEETVLGEVLRQQVGGGGGVELLPKLLYGRYSPSPKLMDAIGRALRGTKAWTLLDEQRLAFNIVRGMAERAAASGEKGVLVVAGGPGTGKSVIAAHLLVKLGEPGRYRVAHATGSKAFTTNLRALVPAGGGAVFRYFNNFTPGETPENALDVLVCDEAHRIRETSNDRFTSRAKRSSLSQVEELIRAGRVSVFFLDQRQNVRPGEIGTVEAIEEAAVRAGVTPQRVQLDAQFRCNGCAPYIEWVDRLMSPEPEPVGGWLRAGDYDLRLFHRPAELEKAIDEQVTASYTGRVVAGFCWPWSDPRSDSSLPPDVIIDDWQRPWNEKAPEQQKGRGAQPRPDRHPYYRWATQVGVVREVGCIYSAQGFEFDYCGVILGNDLVWREGQGWVASRDASYDAMIARRKLRQEQLQALLHHTYRVLLTRGMRGTFVYSTDFETRAMLGRLMG